MLPPVESRRALLRLFQKRPVVTLDTLFETLQTHSRMSVFRRLSAIDYLTSFSHAGRYYTLRAIPEFDDAGLWHHLGVSFSRYGSLKNTVEHMVNESEAGKTYAELELSLKVRVHNTLLDLVGESRIRRVQTDRFFLYVSVKRRQAKAQVARRQEAIKREAERVVGKPPSAVIIEVLLEIIHGAKIVVEPSAIVARLAARGIGVTNAQVEEILKEHGLKKTAKSPSRRSRR